MPHISPRAYGQILTASSWEEIWEAGPYYARVSRLLEDANEYVILVGWQIDSRLRLTDGKETLKERVIRLCQQKPNLKIYFLFWDHATIYVFERELWQARLWENIHQRIYFVFDNRHFVGGSHHEKVCIVDGKTALCGGIDLCDERWDSPQHLYADDRRSLDGRSENHGPYHDLAVQVSGPICQAIQTHVGKRWRALSSVPFPEVKQIQSDQLKNHQIYFSRTIAPMSRDLLHTNIIREVEFLFRDLIWAAQKRIILEGQYYWSQIINDLLIAKIHQMRGTKFEIILILADLQHIKSLTHHMMAYELRLLRKLELAAHFARVKLRIIAPYVMVYPLDSQSHSEVPPRSIYIHSKLLLIDDRYLGIGSTNLADRALRIDSEIQLTLHARSGSERRHIRSVATQILEHWGIEKPRRSVDGQFIYSRPFKPKLQLSHLPKRLNRTHRIPWQYFFDPPLPWFYLLRLRYFKAIRKNRRMLIRDLIMLWLIGIFLCWLIATLYGVKAGWTYISYIALLSSVWLVPIPFFWISCLITFYWGSEVAAILCVSALWVASAFGYFLARVFPAIGPVLKPAWAEGLSFADLEKRMGFRTFQSLVFVLVDPRVSIRSKIICQGFYYLPLPWFLLGNWVILPSIMYLIIKGIGLFQHVYLFPAWTQRPSQVAAGFILFLLLFKSLGEILSAISVSLRFHGQSKTPT